MGQNHNDKNTSPGDNEEMVDANRLQQNDLPDGEAATTFEQFEISLGVQLDNSSGPLTSQNILPVTSGGGLPSQTPKTTYVPLAPHDAEAQTDEPLPPIWPALTPPDSNLWSGAHPPNWLSSLQTAAKPLPLKPPSAPPTSPAVNFQQPIQSWAPGLEPGSDAHNQSENTAAVNVAPIGPISSDGYPTLDRTLSTTRTNLLDPDSQATEFVSSETAAHLESERDRESSTKKGFFESVKSAIASVPRRNLIGGIFALSVVAGLMLCVHLGCLPLPNESSSWRLPNPFHLESGDMRAANALLSENQYASAIKGFTSVLEKEPQSVEGLQGRGKSYFGMRLYRQAVDDFSSALSLEPRSTAARLDRGAALFYLGDYTKARQDYDAIIAIDPKNAFAYFNRGLCESKQSDFTHAVKDLDRAIELKANYSDAYDELAAVFCRQGSLKRAIATFSLSIQVDPKSAKAYFNRGNVYHQDKDNASAITDYSKAIQLNPSHPEYFNNRGYAYLESKQPEKAIADFSSALSLDPDYKLAKANLKTAKESLKH